MGTTAGFLGELQPGAQGDTSGEGTRLKSHLQLLPWGMSEPQNLCFDLHEEVTGPGMDGTGTIVPTTLTPTRGLAPGPGVSAPFQVRQDGGARGIKGGPAGVLWDTVSAAVTRREAGIQHCWGWKVGGVGEGAHTQDKGVRIGSRAQGMQSVRLKDRPAGNMGVMEKAVQSPH